MIKRQKSCLRATAVLALIAVSLAPTPARADDGSGYLKVERRGVSMPIEDQDQSFNIGARIPCVQQNAEYFIGIVEDPYGGGKRLCAFPTRTRKGKGSAWRTKDGELVFAKRTKSASGYFELGPRQQFKILSETDDEYELEFIFKEYEVTVYVPKQIEGFVKIEPPKADRELAPGEPVRIAHVEPTTTEVTAQTQPIRKKPERVASVRKKTPRVLATLVVREPLPMPIPEPEPEPEPEPLVVEAPPEEILIEVTDELPGTNEAVVVVVEESGEDMTPGDALGGEESEEETPEGDLAANSDTAETTTNATDEVLLSESNAVPVEGEQDLAEAEDESALSPGEQVAQRVRELNRRQAQDDGGVFSHLTVNGLTLKILLMIAILEGVLLVKLRKEKESLENTTMTQSYATVGESLPEIGHTLSEKESSFSGTLGTCEIVEILHFLHVSKESGTLSITNYGDSTLSQIMLDEGEIIDAYCVDKSGLAAIEAIGQFETGSFTFTRGEQQHRTRIIETTTTEILAKLPKKPTAT